MLSSHLCTNLKFIFILLLIYFMRGILKIVAVFLLISLISGFHLLKHFDKEIERIKTHYKSGDTSLIFSTFMKMLFQTQILYKQLDILHQKNKTIPPGNCSQMLQELVSMFHMSNWIQIYQEIYPRLNNLAQKCTNADFIEIESDNGFDDKCALCSVITRVMENYVVYHRRDVAKFVEDEFCSMFDGLIKPTCQAFTHYAGPHIIKGLLNKQNSDVICHSAGMCKDPKCKLVDQRSSDQFQNAILKIYGKKQNYNFVKPSPWKWLVHHFVDNFADYHLPPFDADNDGFSDISTFRGYHWRGSDCNQFEANVYPGRKTGNSQLDHDCNGIFGIDEKKKSLQEKYCANTNRLGVVVTGDSAGAHFSIPEKFFNVTMMHHGTFNDLLATIADQLDIPQQSTYTAHTKTINPSHSIYKKLRKLNLCNNNDFQNIAVNGGDSGNTMGNIKALRRDQYNDHPVLLFLQLIGNDVCGSNPFSMTKPQQFKRNILRILNWLDKKLPKGSHVVILGLADGDLLFQFLKGTTHPLDVTYDEVYNFLNCLKISPCAGWLNTNDTIRKDTTRRAKELSKIYRQIIQQSYQFNNFDYDYYDFPTQEIFKRSVLQGKKPSDLIQRCDGFHPSGLFDSFLADWLWFRITQDHPTWIGQENPHNEEIKKLFGLQDLQ